MPASAPLLFIHYGDSPYLAFTLRAARASNPDTRIVLLGDASNRHFARYGVEWIDFATLPVGDEHRAFQHVFTPIIGKTHGKEAWVKFVFERWFFLHEYLQSAGIDAFWTFDSDTVLLRNLAAIEPLLSDVDCTEQCHSMCLNGFVRRADLVRGYLQSINDQFQRPAHLDAWRRYVAEHPDYAFTEMGAWATYKHEAALRVRHLMTPFEGAVFDDAIALAHGMETADASEAGMTMKRVFRDAEGRLYARQMADGTLVRLWSINMSWAPEHLYRRWLPFVWRSAHLDNAPHPRGVVPVPLRRTVVDRLHAALHRARRRVRTALAR